MRTEPVLHADVQAKKVAKETEWFYSDIVKDHFFNPRNIFKTQEEIESYPADGQGMVGSPACGDMMKFWIQVKDEKLVDCRWQTFGCGSAIASTSMLSVMVTENGGMHIDEALKLKPQDIVKRLVELPKRKFHCSVLGDKALRAAIDDYFRKSGQEDRIVIVGARIIDKMLKITDKDIEEAITEGARTFEDVQAKTKVGIQDKTCIPEVKELIKFYVGKYFPEELEKELEMEKELEAEVVGEEIKMAVTKDMVIGDVLKEYPDVAPIMLEFGLHCVGCHANVFDTIEAGCKIHGLEDNVVDELVTKMNEFIASEKKPVEPTADLATFKLSLTENASKKIKELLVKENQESYGLRVAVQSGGCSGNVYQMNFEKEASPADSTFENKGVKLFVDNESMKMLDGSEIDYVDELNESGFKVNNPNSEAGCGCGKSFS